jgi:membrane fusion protein (multidrug efflux system)
MPEFAILSELSHLSPDETGRHLMKSRRLYLSIIVAVLIFLGAVVIRMIGTKGSEEQRRASIPAVLVEQPLRSTLTISLQFTADVLPIQQAAIYSKVSGNLEQIHADMGSYVLRGQLLALIDTTELSQQYDQAKATAVNNRIIFIRSKELFEQNLVAKQDLDNAEAAWKVAAGAYEGAATRLSYARITAPFSGYITKRYLDPGALVTPNSSILFTLMDLDLTKIIVNVLEQDIPRVSLGTQARVTVDAFPGKQFTGRVTKLSQAVDLATRTMAVEIDVPNPEHLLRPGMFADVLLDVGELKDTLTLPTQAFLKDDQGQFVYVVRRDTAYRVRVTTGIEQDSRMLIRSGLDGTEAVITTGQQLVKDRGAVIVQKP